MEYSVDKETGEILLFDPQTCGETAETGEPEEPPKAPFQVLRLLPVALMGETWRNGNANDAFFQIPKHMQKTPKLRKKKIPMEPVPVGASFGQINPIFLFLPAIVYFRWFTVLLMGFEVRTEIFRESFVIFI